MNQQRYQFLQALKYWNALSPDSLIGKEDLSNGQRKSVCCKAKVRVADCWDQVPEISNSPSGTEVFNDFVTSQNMARFTTVWNRFVLTSRFRDVCWGTEMKWLLWQLKLVLVVATCRIRAVLNHFYDELLLHSKTFSANCVWFHYLQNPHTGELNYIFYNSVVKRTIDSRNRDNIPLTGCNSCISQKIVCLRHEQKKMYLQLCHNFNILELLSQYWL